MLASSTRLMRGSNHSLGWVGEETDTAVAG